MTMREEKPNSPSQKKKSTQTKSWFWPVIYSGIAIVFVGMIWGYNAFINNDTPGVKDSAMDVKPGTGELGCRDECSEGNRQISI